MAADADRLTNLYRRFGAAVHRRAKALLGGDEAEAYDVTQDVFLSYFQNESRLRGEARPFTVLYQMATFKAVDRLRSRARWSGKLTSLNIDEDSDSPALQVPAHDDGPARIDAFADVSLLTQGEDEQTLTCAVLYFVEGYTTEEIAQTLDVSRKTVSRALAAFADRAQKRAQRFGVMGAA